MTKETIYLSDSDLELLVKGYSIAKENICITFAKGSKRYIEIKEEAKGEAR